MLGLRLKLAGALLGATVLITGGAGVYSKSKRNAIDSVVDPAPVTAQTQAGSPVEPSHYASYTANGIPILLFGAAHTRNSAAAYYGTLDTLISNSIMVVSEASIDDLNDERNSRDGKAYYGTVAALARKHGKPFVYMDSLSAAGGVLSLGLTLSSIVLLSCAASTAMTTSKDRQSQKCLPFMLLATYLSFAGATGPKEYMTYVLNRHDQRTLELMHRLDYLSGQISSEEALKGNYVLVAYGSTHTAGAEIYRNIPAPLVWSKQAFYAATFDLVDSDRIFRYVPEGDGWRKEMVR